MYLWETCEVNYPIDHIFVDTIREAAVVPKTLIFSYAFCAFKDKFFLLKTLLLKSKHNKPGVYLNNTENS